METGSRVKVIFKNQGTMFKYLFYRIFRFNLKVSIFGESKSGSAMSAVYGISFLIAMNIASIWFYFDRKTDLLNQLIDNFNSFFGTNMATPIAFATVVLIPVYFLFYYKKKYERIIEDVENNDKRKSKVNNVLAIMYQIVTIVVFFVLFFS